MFKVFAFPSVGRVALILSLAGVLLVDCSLPLFGQTAASTASVSGTITDQTGARIADATVTLSSPQQAITRTFKTSPSGAFSFSLLQPSVYSLTVEASGFKTYKQGGVVLTVGQTAELNAVLSPGSMSQQVVVSGQAPLLTTDSPNIGSEISGKLTLEMPLNFRSSLALIYLNSSSKWFEQGTVGGSVDTADQDYSLGAVGGQFFASNSFLLDGTWNGTMAYNGAMYVPSIDTVQETKIQTNTFTAQYAMTEGNVVNVITKSGTDQFHGDVYEFFRNYALDANYFFNKLAGRPRPTTRMNQFGATAGGPLYIPGISSRHRNRTFFFVGYEGLRLGAVSSLLSTMPTTAMKSGDLSALLGAQTGTDAMGKPIFVGQIYNPFSTRQIGTNPNGSAIYYRDPVPNNNIANIPGLMDAVAKNMVSYFPSPTNPNPSSNNFFASASVPTTSNEMNVRIDQNVGNSGRFYARYSRKWEAKVESAPLYGANNPAGPGQTNPDNRYNIAAGYSQVLTPTLTLSSNFGFSRWVEGNVSQGYPFKSSSLGLPPALDADSPFFPLVKITGFGSLGNATEESTASNEGSITVDFAKVHGNSTFSFGYMGILSQILGGGLFHTTFSYTSAFTNGPNPQSPAAGTGNAFGSFLMGATASGNTGVTELPEYSKIYNGWYLQDDWKATQNLTLNLGLRYDIQLPPTEKRNRQAYFERNQQNPISQLATGGPYYGQLVYNTSGNRYMYQPSYTNVSPRVGFSYLTDNKLVTRGGFALFFPMQWGGDPTQPGYAQVTTLVSSLNGGLNPSSTLSNPFPQGILPVIGNTQDGLTNVGQSVNTTFYKRPSSYIEQWMFGLQYLLTPRDVIEATYIGNRTLKFEITGLNLNQLPPADLALGSSALTAPVANPFFGLAPVAKSSCGLANATTPAYQFMLPMPQFCDSVTNAKANAGSSNYNALVLKYTHRFSNNLTILANYTHSKFISDTEGGSGFELFYPEVVRNNYDLAAERSVDYSDTPNAAVFSYIYALPIGRGQTVGSNFSRPVNAVLGGWQIAGITSFRQGTPIGINGNLNASSVYGGGQHANVVGNPNAPGPVAANPTCVAPNRLKTAQHWYNPCAFVAANPGTFGDAPRYLGNLRTPGYDDTDLSISKYFYLPKSIRTQFRAEMFNTFNHVNFGPPANVTVGTSTAGSLSYADIARQIQFALKIYW